MNTPSSTCRVVYSFDSAPDDGTLDDDGHGSNVSAIVSKVATKLKLLVLMYLERSDRKVSG